MSSRNRSAPHDGQDRFWNELEEELKKDDDSAARAHLAAGYPIYVIDADTPRGTIVKIFPAGDRQLIMLDLDGERVISPSTGVPEDGAN
ncbi:hypothetical protein [Caballeronia sordidicola]|uniref:hypothetical protein n=1 Tax=Caballeronia sordidicola TaxID=196367 RepID=UPI000B77451C|nr:hypothetical protein [Caballeronia sordidicola]